MTDYKYIDTHICIHKYICAYKHTHSKPISSKERKHQWKMVFYTAEVNLQDRDDYTCFLNY